MIAQYHNLLSTYHNNLMKRKGVSHYIPIQNYFFHYMIFEEVILYKSMINRLERRVVERMLDVGTVLF